ncbi:MAG: hypothetical protein EA349_11375 [Halomonadaceae bacterium]|nr:MAG: hypothetical protein EA349_11375 [Halomonadaceae bacterium]
MGVSTPPLLPGFPGSANLASRIMTRHCRSGHGGQSRSHRWRWTMNKPLRWLAAVLLTTMAGWVSAEDLGITMSIMADDEQDLTGSISRQIELSEPTSQQPRAGNRLLLLQELRRELSTEQRREIFAGNALDGTLSSDDLERLVAALDNQQLRELVSALSGDSLVSLLETLDTNRATRLIEELSGDEQKKLLDKLLDLAPPEDEDDGGLLPFLPLDGIN